MASDTHTNLPEDGLEQAVQALEFPHVDRSTAVARTRWHEAHHAFAAGITQRMPEWFRTSAELAWAPHPTTLAEEESHLFSDPGCYIAFHCVGFSDPTFLHFDPTSLFLWLDCLLGGCGSGIPPRRQPTAVEQRLIRFTATEILQVWDAAYRGAHSLAPTVSEVTQHPQSLLKNSQTIPFDLCVGTARGTLNVIVSHDNYQRHLDQLTSPLTRPALPPSPEATSQLGSSCVELVVNLAELKVRTSELMGLQVGDIITTDTLGDDLVSVHVEGKPKFQATVGSLRGHKAIRFAG